MTRAIQKFTLPAVVPPLPLSMVFGKMDPEDEKTEMIPCITALQLRENTTYIPPRDVYEPTSRLLG